MDVSVFDMFSSIGVVILVAARIGRPLEPLQVGPESFDVAPGALVSPLISGFI